MYDLQGNISLFFKVLKLKNSHFSEGRGKGEYSYVSVLQC